MLQKLQVKLVALVMGSVVAILLVIGVGFCVYLYNTNNDAVHNTLSQANEQAATNYRESQNQIGSLENNLLNDFFGQTTPPGQKPNTKKPSIGRQNDTVNQTPVASYYINKSGNLEELDSGLITAYIDNDVLSQLSQNAKNAHEGMNEDRELGIVYCKNVINGTTFISCTDSSYVYTWTSMLQQLLILMICAIVVFFVVSIIFAKRAAKPIKEAWDAQERFVEDASHDLKTPLTVILTNTSILQSKPEKTIAEQNQWIESTQTEAKRMQGLINNMLDMARIEDFAKNETVENVQLEAINFSQIVEGECLETETIAFDKKLKFTSNIESDIYVKATKDELVKAASTVISNSCKHAPKNDEITITLQKERNDAVLRVNNKLSLIAAEDLPHIFERFYRANKARERENEDVTEQSHGLGLAIAHAAVEKFGGKLTATSSKENGTTFIAVLPLAKKPSK